MSNKQKSFEQIICENGMPVYAVFPCPEWEFYDAELCPAPIRDWVEQYYPDVEIVRLSGFSTDYLGPASDRAPSGLLSELLPCPVFYIGFNEAQAAHFTEEWRKRDLVDNFYFVTGDGYWTLSDNDKEELFVQIQAKARDASGFGALVSSVYCSLIGTLGKTLRRAFAKNQSIQV